MFSTKKVLWQFKLVCLQIILQDVESLMWLFVFDNCLTPFGLWLIFVAPAPDIVCPIACPLHSLLHHTGWHALEIVRPADLREEVNESRRCVQTVVAQFGCFVVPWERVMVVVPSFAKGQSGYSPVLGWIDESVDEEFFNENYIICSFD